MEMPKKKITNFVNTIQIVSKHTIATMFRKKHLDDKDSASPKVITKVKDVKEPNSPKHQKTTFDKNDSSPTANSTQNTPMTKHRLPISSKSDVLPAGSVEYDDSDDARELSFADKLLVIDASFLRCCICRKQLEVMNFSVHRNCFYCTPCFLEIATGGTYKKPMEDIEPIKVKEYDFAKKGFEMFATTDNDEENQTSGSESNHSSNSSTSNSNTPKKSAEIIQRPVRSASLVTRNHKLSNENISKKPIPIQQSNVNSTPVMTSGIDVSAPMKASSRVQIEEEAFKLMKQIEDI